MNNWAVKNLWEWVLLLGVFIELFRLELFRIDLNRQNRAGRT